MKRRGGEQGSESQMGLANLFLLWSISRVSNAPRNNLEYLTLIWDERDEPWPVIQLR
jgi:hypothetical protein